MISDGKKCHYLAVNKLSALLRRVTSNNNVGFYCSNFLIHLGHILIQECKDHDYCYIEMPKENNKILKYNHGEKSMKVSFIIYFDLESLLEKMRTCHNNPKKLSTTKINKHRPSGYSLLTHCSFEATKN